MNRSFQLTTSFDLAAVFLFAVTGALAARRKRYDLVGATVLALTSSVAGGILRDLLLQQGTPAALTDGRYLLAVFAGTGAVALFERHLDRLRLVIAVVDALGLGIYGVVGTDKALRAGLPILTALLIGTVNAVGGSLLRDVLVREEPLVFKPGQWYALSSFFGCTAFALLSLVGGAPAHRAALVGIAVAFSTRLLSIRLGWHTAPLGGSVERL